MQTRIRELVGQSAILAGGEHRDRARERYVASVRASLRRCREVGSTQGHNLLDNNSGKLGLSPIMSVLTLAVLYVAPTNRVSVRDITADSPFAQSDVSAVLVNFRFDMSGLEGRQVATFSLILVRSANGAAFEPISSSS